MKKHTLPADKPITKESLEESAKIMFSHLAMLKEKLKAIEDIILTKPVMSVSEMTDLFKQAQMLGDLLSWFQNINYSRVIEPKQKMAHSEMPDADPNVRPIGEQLKLQANEG